MFSIRFLPFWALACFLLPTLPLRAELIWSAETGWRLEGGALSGLAGEQGRNALELMNDARSLEENGSEGRAARTYKKVYKNYSSSVYAPEALYRAAEIAFHREQYFRAFDLFDEVVRKYPNNDKFLQVIERQFHIATLLLDGARAKMFGVIPGFRSRERGIEYFERIVANAPYSDYAPVALMNVARGHEMLGNDEEAIYALDRLVNAYPRSLIVPEAYIKLAQAHADLVAGAYYDQGATRDALTYFEDFMILFPENPNVSAAEEGVREMREILAQSKMRIGDFYHYRRDNYQAARILYNEAITVFPNSEVASLARSRLEEVERKSAEEGPADSVESAARNRFWLF